MIEIKNLTKRFNNITAVNSLSFSVPQGTIFGLLGPNGAGKTTTIRCILNIIKPDEGEIIFDNNNRDENFLNQIGYLPEERGLYSKSSVIEVISYFASLKGLNYNDIKQKAKFLLEKLEIPHYTNKKINELSKGNQQKVQFIASIIHNPRLLFLDEPFSGLDPINQTLVKDIILELIESGASIVLSTHQMELAEKLCSQILLINKGKEVLHGTLTEIKKGFGKISVFIRSNQIDNNLKSFEEIESADIYENSAEVLLKQGYSPHSFLKKIIEKYQINSFEIKEPSLHSIFIQAVSKSTEN
ncbi:MAG: ATP-binding cassette domain-containing protein [Ignavibacteria bacterium]|nr:ATP-binding cassette domain-containing protein [Ignavibacteria bacterium]